MHECPPTRLDSSRRPSYTRLSRPLVALVALVALLPVSTSAQSESEAAAGDGTIADLWTEYEVAQEVFRELMTEVEQADPLTVPGHRKFRAAIDAGIDLANLVESLLSIDATIEPEERNAAVDMLLTTRQVVGSLLVDVEECDEAVTVLEGVLRHPLLDEPGREIVRNRARAWLTEARACAGEPEAMPTPGMSSGPARSDSSRRGGSTVGPWAVMAGGAATMIGGFVWSASLSGTRDEFDDLRARCTGSQGCSDAEWATVQDHEDSLTSARAPIIALTTVGGAAIVGGAIWLFAARPTGEETGRTTRRIDVYPAIGKGHAGIGLLGRFR